MTCQNIYDLAMAFISENANGSDVSDLATRAPFLLYAACIELSDLDYWYRMQFENEDIVRGEGIAPITALTAAFPLSDRLATAAAYYLGKMLVADENTALSEKLNVLLVRQIEAIKGEIVAEIMPITDIY